MEVIYLLYLWPEISLCTSKIKTNHYYYKINIHKLQACLLDKSDRIRRIGELEIRAVYGPLWDVGCANEDEFSVQLLMRLFVRSRPTVHVNY